MRRTQGILVWLLIGPSLALACRPGAEDVPPPDAAYRERTPRFHFAGGKAFAVASAGRGDAVFTAELTTEDAPSELAARLASWAAENRVFTGLGPGAGAADLALVPARSVVRDRDVKIYRFEQTYRSLPVVGPESQVSVMVGHDREVRSVLGGFVDQRPDYTGLYESIDAETASQRILDAWEARPEPPGDPADPGDLAAGPGGGDSPGGLVATPPGPTVRRLEKVALPGRQAIAWRGEVVGPSLAPGDTILGHVLVAAADGAAIAVVPAGARLATVRAHEMEDDPFTTAQRNYPNVPATVFGNTIDFSPDVEGPDGPVECTPDSSRDYRLGDSQRLTVVDFGDTLDQPVTPTVEACSTDGEPFFGNSNAGSDRFEAQDMMVKTYAALFVLDPLKGEMFTHGSEHTYSWDHHPDVPDIMHRPTLVLFANHGEGAEGCDDANGVFRGRWAEQGSPWLEDLEIPVWHPGIFTADDRALFAEISVCGTAFNGALFHEIGHYYDGFSAYGVLGEFGPGYSECCLDRPNEARSMAESVAQLFALYLMERLYPQLDYTLSAMPDPGDSCGLSSLSSHMPSLVVHPDCMDDADQIWTLNEKRPTGPDASVGCNPESPNAYGVHAQTQAFWSLLFGQQCAATGGGGVTCDLAHSPLPGGYSIRWMEALLASLQMGNLHSFVSLWDNMEAYIGVNYPGDVAFLQSVRALHGLVPLPHGLDPSCDCPTLGGCA